MLAALRVVADRGLARKPGMAALAAWFIALALLGPTAAKADGEIPKESTYCTTAGATEYCSSSLTGLTSQLDSLYRSGGCYDNYPCTSAVLVNGQIYLVVCYDGPGYYYPGCHSAAWVGPLSVRIAAACPLNSVAVGSAKCNCSTGFSPAGSPSACVPRFDIDSASKPPGRCTPKFGDPIYPLTGIERYRIELGISLAGNGTALTYDTGRRTPTVLADLDLVNSDDNAFGELWRSSLHRKVTAGPSNSGARVSRGNGDTISFARAADGSFIADADTNDRLTNVPGGYRYLDISASTLESYSEFGQLMRVDRAAGGFITLSFSNADTPAYIAPAAGYLIAAQDHFGRLVSFVYELPIGGSPARDGRVTTITAQGKVFAFAYTASNLTALTWPDAQVRRFRYERPGLPWALSGVTDENGAAHASISYDAAGRAISSALAGGVDSYVFSYVQPPAIATSDVYYPADGFIVRTRTWQIPNGLSITDPRGATKNIGASLVQGISRVSSQSQPAGSGCNASVSAQSYDANGNLAVRDDFNGYRICYANDPSRNLETVRVEGLPNSASCAVTGTGSALPAGARKTSTQWHPDWSLPIKQAEPGRITTSIYNGQPDLFPGGAVSSCAPTSATLPDGKRIVVLCHQVDQATTDVDGSQGFAAQLQAGVAAREQRWNYNQAGQVLSATDPLGNITNYAYYTDTAFTGTDPTAAGHTVGDLKTVTNSAGHATQHTLYNKTGQVLQMVDANGIVTAHEYDARQRLTSTVVGGQTSSYAYWPTGLLKRATQPDGSYVGYGYDDAHRLVNVSDNLGNSITYTLDNAGNRTAETVIDATGSLRRQLGRSIDALGRVQQVTGRP